MRAIRNQKFNPKMQEYKLWASEKRSPNERRRCKLVSKLKGMLIEHDKHEAKNVVVNYKWFHVRLRDGMGYRSVAMGDHRWKDGMDGQGWIGQCHCQRSNGRTGSEYGVGCPDTSWKQTMGMFNSAWAIEQDHEWTLSMRNLLNCMLYRKMFRAYGRTEGWKICCRNWPYVNLICFVYRNVWRADGEEGYRICSRRPDIF